MGTTVNKVIRPPVSPGVKDDLYLARRRVDSAEVWPFVEITTMAGERKVFDIVAASMLAGDNVLDLVRHFAVILGEPAVLAVTACPVSDEKASPGIHC